jgi:FkbM family methyltransferase
LALLYIGYEAGSDLTISRQTDDGTWETLKQDKINDTGPLRVVLSFAEGATSVKVGDLATLDIPLPLDRLWRIGGTGQWSDSRLLLSDLEQAKELVRTTVQPSPGGQLISGRPIVFDIGMHNGEDTAYYLAKGFCVVSVDANPMLCAAVARRYRDEVTSGRLVILNVGIGKDSNVMPFYVNLENTEWSSFRPEVASRGHPTTCINVNVEKITRIIEAFGVPYYLKVDIEGYDKWAVLPSAQRKVKPQYISYENAHIHIFDELVSHGYQKFQLVNQSKVQESNGRLLGKEGLPLRYEFSPGSSGPFGQDLAGEWLDVLHMRERLLAYQVERLEGLKKSLHGEWFDLHASL